jgi:REP element-mobilizing transposase RayT
MSTAAPIQPEHVYHVYNRANGAEQLFLSSENYLFFLRKFEQYISPVADVFCYCLLPNHFHFLIRIKNEQEIKTNLPVAFPKFGAIEKLVSKQFSKLFSSYTQAFNKVNGRKGSLFMKSFKRKEVTSQNYLLKLIHYIHLNPVVAGLVSTAGKWTFSSYPAFNSNKKTRLLKQEVIALFTDLENFKYYHQSEPDVKISDF